MSQFQMVEFTSLQDIVLSPATNEIQKLMLQTLRDTVDGAKYFIRWLDGTCIETPSQQNPDSDEPYLFTFHADILPVPALTEICLSIMENIQKILLNTTKIALKWRKFKPIWKLDKTLVAEKFAVKSPSCIEFDKQLQFYTNLRQVFKLLLRTRSDWLRLLVS